MEDREGNINELGSGNEREDGGRMDRWIGIREFPVYKKSPFISQMVRIKDKARNRITSIARHPVSYTDKNKDQETIFMHTQKPIDREGFVKIYVTNIRMLFDLSRSAARIFYYILNCLRINDDRILFNVEHCMEFTGMKSRATVYRSMGELMQHEVIARTSTYNIFYVNPMMVFNGDRLIVINDYINNQPGIDAVDMSEGRSRQLVAEIDNKETDKEDWDDKLFTPEVSSQHNRDMDKIKEQDDITSWQDDLPNRPV